MAKKKETWLKIISGLIAIMFFYAVYIKLKDYEAAKKEMYDQVFSTGVADFLTWFIPVIELLIILLLVLKPTRLLGFWATLGILGSFSIYIILAMNDMFHRKPCECAGILNGAHFGWQVSFNLLFMILALLGIWLEKDWKIKNLLKRTKNAWFNAKNFISSIRNKKVMRG